MVKTRAQKARNEEMAVPQVSKRRSTRQVNKKKKWATAKVIAVKPPEAEQAVTSHDEPMDPGECEVNPERDSDTDIEFMEEILHTNSTSTVGMDNIVTDQVAVNSLEVNLTVTNHDQSTNPVEREVNLESDSEIEFLEEVHQRTNSTPNVDMEGIVNNHIAANPLEVDLILTNHDEPVNPVDCECEINPESDSDIEFLDEIQHTNSIPTIDMEDIDVDQIAMGRIEEVETESEDILVQTIPENQMGEEVAEEFVLQTIENGEWVYSKEVVSGVPSNIPNTSQGCDGKLGSNERPETDMGSQPWNTAVALVVDHEAAFENADDATYECMETALNPEEEILVTVPHVFMEEGVDEFFVQPFELIESTSLVVEINELNEDVPRQILHSSPDILLDHQECYTGPQIEQMDKARIMRNAPENETSSKIRQEIVEDFMGLLSESEQPDFNDNNHQNKPWRYECELPDIDVIWELSSSMILMRDLMCQDEDEELNSIMEDYEEGFTETMQMADESEVVLETMGEVEVMDAQSESTPPPHQETQTPAVPFVTAESEAALIQSAPPQDPQGNFNDSTYSFNYDTNQELQNILTSLPHGTLPKHPPNLRYFQNGKLGERIASLEVLRHLSRLYPLVRPSRRRQSLIYQESSWDDFD